MGLSGNMVVWVFETPTYPTPALTLMWIALTIIASIYLTGLLVLASAVLRAPEGFEDDQGFHEGRIPTEDDLVT